MEHFICTGGCKGLSDKPGTCMDVDCPKYGEVLLACDCTDGLHFGHHDVVDRELESEEDAE